MTLQLSDDFPVLLGPVRVEIRFTPAELLVRVFPDDWQIEKFESDPTEAEVGALDAYWIARWAAGGRAGALDAAWQELATRIPPTRAGWLLASRVPENPADEPSGVATGTTVLVIVSDHAPAANDRQPAVTYWTAVWRAHGDRVKLRQADKALNNAVNTDRAAAIRARRPVGLAAAPVVKGNDVVVAFVVLRPPAKVARGSWTQAATARLLPDRFMVLGYAGGEQVLSATGAPVPTSLPVGPRPGAPDQITIDERTGALHVPDELRWLTDFDRAVQNGMGLRIPLDDRTRNGFDRLLVLGLREQASPAQSRLALENLIKQQLRGPDGYALLPQGTPTNNTGEAPAGQSPEDEAAASLRSPATGTDWSTRTDGQQFAELLGLDPAALTGMPNADGADQRDARAANTALWPATWGYFLQTALRPVLGTAAVEATRDFFLRYVSGRGPISAVRIGRQPYGILPTTAFSRLAWPATATHRKALHKVLSAAHEDWLAATAKVTRLGDRNADPHQALLDVLALHPTSAEYHQRYARGVEDAFNRENLGGLGGSVLPALDLLGQPAPVRSLLARFGVDVGGPGGNPEVLRRLFADAQQPLLAPLVDDRPPSETDLIRAYTPDGRNYVRRLADLAGKDLHAVRLELGFSDDVRPATLLYLLLRHAVLLGWADTARALAGAGPDDLADPPFVHVRIPAAGQLIPSESRFRRLYAPDPAVTGSQSQLVVDHIPGALLQGRPGTAALGEQVKALGVLANLPTARLERVLAEHLDLATYRLDAWRLGLATERLNELRYGPSGAAPPSRGLHLGAYGWLENVCPGNARLTPVPLTGRLAQIFAGSAPLLHDPANEGFVHAPSPGQARTAAVLRAGYAANRMPDSPRTFAVNLSADRVRTALTVLDGLRQGQSLGALLGYRFERGLHDRHDQAEVDRFIAALRLAFPLRAGKIAQTATEPDAIQQIEARNVIDGLALVRHVTRGNAPRAYKFGLPQLPDADPDQARAINEEVERLIDVNDAVADLAVAESTHQALSGNAQRASANLDAYAKDGLPPDPAVIATPRSGTTLTHRFALQLRGGLDPGQNPPRAQAEPAVNDWLSDQLPDPDAVVAKVTWTDPADGHAHDHTVSQDDLGLEPIELLWTVRTAGDAALADLDDRIVGFVLDHEHIRPDTELNIEYTRQVPGKVTFFELSPLVTALRTLLTTGRPLVPGDLVPASSGAPADRAADAAVSLPRERPAAVRRSLADLGNDAADNLKDLTSLYPAPPAAPHRADVLRHIDDLLADYAGLVSRAARFGMVRSGWGELFAWRRGVYADVLAAVAAVAGRMTAALAEADTILDAYDHLPKPASNVERLELLRRAAKLISPTPASELPDRPGDLRGKLKDDRKKFAKRLDGLREQAETDERTLSGLLDEVGDRLPLDDVDPVGLDLTPFGDRVVAFGRELLERTLELQDEVTDRLAGGDTALAAYDQAVPGPERLRAGLDALRAMLGADALAVPEYTLPEALADDLRHALRDSDDLVEHLTGTRDFPVDDWLHGVARVREMPRLWERVVLLGEALRDHDGPELRPVQLPFRQHDHWLGMEFASGAAIGEDKLLLTAHYADDDEDFDDELCGLLLDEWTEVIPAEREATGIAVHSDSPDSEPPQAMLLVVPPAKTGVWKLEDLVAAVIETFELARTRLVEPAHLDDRAYAQLLPATVMSATRQPITISTDLAVANARWKADHD
ncbi:hypothetical protein [Nonomuraea insulae]|uniref:Uncharacterized protein n=1 Tax=Nonomuraea insulae TaxID=1616787 RepID=A0ABW1D1W7_9ACTN